MHLSVIIPVHNEEKRLPKTLASINGYLPKQTYDYEILVIDNGSTDKTAEIVKSFIARMSGLRLVEGSASQGKGFAVAKGMTEAKGDYRVFTDADNSTSIDQVEKMWPEFEKGYDIVIGSRDIKGAVLEPPQPFLRKIILGNGFKLLRKLIIGFWDIADTQCGFKGFKAKAARDIFSRLTTFGFAFDVEALVLAKKMGYRFKEVPVRWVNDLESKVGSGHIIKMLLEIIKIRIKWLKKIK